MRVSLFLLCFVVLSTGHIVIGMAAKDNGVPDALALGRNASPNGPEHSLALRLNPASVSGQALGLTLNGQSCFIPKHSVRLTIVAGTGTTHLSAHSAPIHVFRVAHHIVLPPSGDLEPGDQFTLIAQAGALSIQTHFGHARWTLASGTEATLLYAGPEEWIVRESRDRL